MIKNPPKDDRRRDDDVSAVERQKAASVYLRGGIRRTLADTNADRFGDEDLNVLKFHGVYQQYDRDERAAGGQSRSGRQCFLMVRVRIPGGVLDADQWLVLDDLARTHGDHSLRLTTRQSLQFHRVVQGDLASHIRALDATLLTTLAACGDIARNVMCCPAIDGSPLRAAAQATTQKIAAELSPRTTAYHEIWVDGERVDAAAGHDTEPLYGRTYLPRKFKTGIALPGDNCVDVYTQDCGLIAVPDVSGGLAGFNVLVGGGLGMTHRKPDTFARLASPLGFIPPERAVDTVRAIVEIFRDEGNRVDRRHARLKYLIEERGEGWFAIAFRARAGFTPASSAPLTSPGHDDHVGWHDQGDGRLSFGLFVENGRLRGHALDAVREIVATLRPGVRLTPHQNILFTHLAPAERDTVTRILETHDLPDLAAIRPVRRHAMACPALPTCGLALADAERALPSVIDELETLVADLGLGDEDVTVRMTGCPNGCARPYTADVALVGRGPDTYDVYVGGGLAGDRLVDLLAEKVRRDAIVPTLRPLLEAWRGERRPGEGLGDFWQRCTGRVEPRRVLRGDKTCVDFTVDGRVVMPGGAS